MKFSKFLLISLIGIFLQAEVLADCLNGLDSIYSQGKDYFFRSQYLLASQQFSLFSQITCDLDKRESSRLRWAQSLFELGETTEGELILSKISPKSSYFQTSRIIRAWYQPSLMTTLPEVEQARFEEWNKQINQLPRIKNVWLSGAMSAIVPGLGQIYNGNYQSAAFSFVLNALFFSATMELHQKKLDATALTSGVIFSVVYLGNIAGTVYSSKEINQSAQESMKHDLKMRLFPELIF